MPQMLIALEDKKFGHLIQNSIFQKYGIEALVQTGVLEAKSMLEILPDLTLVICQEKFAPNICEYIINHHETLSREITVLILGKKKTLYPHATAI